MMCGGASCAKWNWRSSTGRTARLLRQRGGAGLRAARLRKCAPKGFTRKDEVLRPCAIDGSAQKRNETRYLAQPHCRVRFHDGRVCERPLVFELEERREVRVALFEQGDLGVFGLLMRL